MGHGTWDMGVDFEPMSQLPCPQLNSLKHPQYPVRKPVRTSHQDRFDMRFALPLAALALVTQTVTAQAPASLTLDEAVSLARRNNPLFQQTINARRSADANVRTAYASLLPTVNAQFFGRTIGRAHVCTRVT